jgi:hypothetical protein
MSLASDPDKGLLLETLLLTPCLLAGKTRFDESKASVWIKPQADETILFFSIDDQSNTDCRLRQLLWGDKAGENICDLIVFYAKGNERVFCFVELKDNLEEEDLTQAIKQVTNTYTHFRRHLRLNYRYTAKTFISSPKSSIPKPHLKYQSMLLKVFKEASNIEYNGKADEFGDFLRGVRYSDKGKRKRKKGKKQA